MERGGEGRGKGAKKTQKLRREKMSRGNHSLLVSFFKHCSEGVGVTKVEAFNNDV